MVIQLTTGLIIETENLTINWDSSGEGELENCWVYASVELYVKGNPAEKAKFAKHRSQVTILKNSIVAYL